MVRRYMWNLLGAISQVLNTIFAGSQIETICSRLYRNKQNRYVFYAYIISNYIFFWQEDHCAWSYKQGVKLASIFSKREGETI